MLIVPGGGKRKAWKKSAKDSKALAKKTRSNGTGRKRDWVTEKERPKDIYQKAKRKKKTGQKTMRNVPQRGP